MRRAETKVIEPVNVDYENAFHSVVFLPKLTPKKSIKGFSPRAIKYFPQTSVEPKHKSPDPAERMRKKHFRTRENRLESVNLQEPIKLESKRLIKDRRLTRVDLGTCLNDHDI